jgi:hypothetical protein
MPKTIDDCSEWNALAQSGQLWDRYMLYRQFTSDAYVKSFDAWLYE